MKRTARPMKRLAVATLAALAPLGAWSASGEFTFVVGEVSLTKARKVVCRSSSVACASHCAIVRAVRSRPHRSSS